MTHTTSKQSVIISGLIISISLIAGNPSAASAANKSTPANAMHALDKWLATAPEKRPPLDKQDFASAALSRNQAEKAENLLFEDFIAATKKTLQAEWNAKIIRAAGKEMKFDFRLFGYKPDAGRSLFISMHGGGGTAPKINDGQWRNQIRLYKPAEGVYLAPRAPTDTWNLWHQKHIDALFDRLILAATVCMDVNPNRVYLMGYSAGGDGVYQLAPRMADRWAAAAMMSGHPNDASPLSLRNIGFTLHAGGRDAAYNRNNVAAEWKEKLTKLRQNDPQGYAHEAVIHEDLGHWMNLKDAVAVPWMAKFTRNPLPRKIVWRQDDVTHDRFYWLALPKGTAKAKSLVTASRKGNRIDIEEGTELGNLILLLNDDMTNLDKPVSVFYRTKELFNKSVPRTIAVLYETIAQRGDRNLAFPAKIAVKLK